MPLPEHSRRHDRILLRKRQQVLVTGNQIISLRREQSPEHLLVRSIAKALIPPTIRLSDVGEKREAINQVTNLILAQPYPAQTRQHPAHLIQNVPRQHHIQPTLDKPAPTPEHWCPTPPANPPSARPFASHHSIDLCQTFLDRHLGISFLDPLSQSIEPVTHPADTRKQVRINQCLDRLPFLLL